VRASSGGDQRELAGGVSPSIGPPIAVAAARRERWNAGDPR